MHHHEEPRLSSRLSAVVTRGVDPFTQGYVRKKARQIAGKYGFALADRDEIEQRLYLKLVKHLDAADPDDPKWKAFVAKTVKRQIATMIRDSEAAKRDHRRAGSIHVSIASDEGPVELAATLGDHEVPSRRGRVQRSEQELAELLLDLASCLADVADRQHREFCERLKHASISQVARDMDVPRTTLNAWLVKLRRRFQERGLSDYV